MSVLSYGLQSLHLLQFGVQSHIFSLVFRVTISSQFDVQSLYLLQFGVQSRISSLAFRVTIPSQFDVQTFRAFIFFSLAFRAASLAWCLESLSLHSLTFRAFIFFSLAFKAASLAWRLESLSLHSLTFRAFIFFSLAFKAAISSQFSLQSHVFSLAFRATIPSQFGRLEPPSLSNLAFRVTVPSQFGVQSHHPITIEHSLPSFRHSEPHSLHSESSFIVWSSESSFIPGVQSHHILGSVFRATFLAFRVLKFRVAFLFQFGVQSHIASIQGCHFLLVQRQSHSYHSEPLSSVLGVQSHVFNLEFNLEFRATSLVQRSEPHFHFGIQSHHLLLIWYSEPPSLLSFGVRCHHLPLVLTFRAVMHTHFDIQSHNFSSILAFKAILPQPCHSESQLSASIFTSVDPAFRPLECVSDSMASSNLI